MDAFTINLDLATKSGSFTSSRALGAYTQIALSVYGFRAAPDLQTLEAKIYVDAGTVLSVCSSFVADGTIAGMYNATLSLSTDTAIAYFSTKKPNFAQDLTIVVSDGTTLFCNARIQVKNNPNAVPSSPTPVTTRFLLEAPIDGVTYGRKDAGWTALPDAADIVTKSDEGFTADLGSASEVFDMNDAMTAAQVRRGLITLTKYLHEKGVI